VFTRYAMALASSKGNLMQAAAVAKTMWSDTTPEVERIMKAAVAAGTTTDSTWAAPLVDYRVATEEFVELLRPETILGKIEAKLRRVPFNVRIPRQTAGSSVGWVGEGAPKPVGKLAFDTITMPETKIAGIVVITQELARFSSPQAEALVRADMIEAISLFTDTSFINPALAGVTGVNPASITNGAEKVKSTGTTLAQIEADLMAAMLWFTTRNIPLSSAVWIMNPATKMALAWKRTAQDVAAFPGVDQGVLKGIPIVESNSVGQYDFDAAGTDNALAYFVALVSAPNILLADDGQVMLDSSAEASISMTDDGAGTTLTSLWQRNMIGLRAERFIHWMNRRANAVYVITDAVWS
jgi:HK97 family phage major capsid protein